MRREVFVPVAVEELYPLIEITKVEGVDLHTLVESALKKALKEKALELYAEGKVTLSKLAEILNLSIWETIEVVQEAGIPLQMGKVNVGS